MIRFIEDHRADHGVEPICRMLPIAPATFYDHQAKRADPSRLSDRAVRDAQLKPEIERVRWSNKLPLVLAALSHLYGEIFVVPIRRRQR